MHVQLISRVELIRKEELIRKDIVFFFLINMVSELVFVFVYSINFIHSEINDYVNFQ